MLEYLIFLHLQTNYISFMYLRFSIVVALLFLTSLIHGQSVNSNDAEKCYTDQRMDEKLQDPSFAEAREAARATTAQILQQNSVNNNKSGEILYTIPVVFHVIHKGEPEGTGTNISDEQVQSTIDALNRDYGATSADGGIAQSDLPVAAGNTNIEFCLASVDPQGNSTSGINRVDGTSVFLYGAQGITGDNEVSVKDLSRWDNRYYLNVWVVSEIDDNGADVADPDDWQGGTAGYAYLPTDPVTFNSDRDGIVILNLCTGNDPNGSEGFRLAYYTNNNRVLTHEVGHFLDLYHPFEGESCSEFNCNTEGDLVCDTPPTVLNNDCSSPACSGTQQVENYMDYTSQTCTEMFSEGQKDRMRAVLDGVRNDLVNTSNCSSPTDYDAGLVILNSSGSGCESGSVVPQVEITNYGAETLTSLSFDYQLNSEPTQNYDWSGSLTTGQSEEINLPSIDPPDGTNTLEVELDENSLNGSNLDENSDNDDDSWSFSPGGGTQIQFNLVLDQYGSETTWEFEDSNGNLVESGGPYSDGTEGMSIEESFCLPDGCYTFTIFDEFGDGICCEWGFGLYSIENVDTGEALAIGGEFGSTEVVEFCLGGTNDECEATSENCDEFINSVSLADYENTSGCDNYNLNSPAIELSEGVEYTLTVETQDGSGEFIGYTDDQVAAWIDWNGNGDFTDPGEEIFSITYNEENEYPNTGSFTVPADPGVEELVMRVRMSYLPDDGPIQPCGTSMWGEVEDYLIQVVQPEGVLTLDDTPDDVEISCEADTSISALGDVTANTTCNAGTSINSSYSDEVMDGDCANEYTITRSWVIEDQCGNIVTYQQEITVVDEESPVVSCNVSEAEVSTEGENVPIPDLTDEVTATDNCSEGLNIEQVPTPGTMVPPGSYTLDFTAEDDCGNIGECSIELDVIDTEAVLSLEDTPSDVEISCEEDSSPSNTGDLQASTTCGNASLDISFEDDIEEGTCEGEYTIVRNWTVEDQCNNVATYEQEISVSDETAPVFDCEGIDMEITTPEEEAGVPAFITEASATDNCTEDLVIEQSPEVGTQLPAGVHEITLTTEDDCGNTAQCTAQLTIESTVGLNEALESEIELFPNPTKGIVEIRLSESMKGEVQFEVYSANGRLVLSETTNANAIHTLDISKQPTGLYMIKIGINEFVAVKMLNKE